MQASAYFVSHRRGRDVIDDRTRMMAVVALIGLAIGGRMAAQGQAEGSKAAPSSKHTLLSAKLNVSPDPRPAQEFYQRFFGMKEVGHFRSGDSFDEPIVSFEKGAPRLALLSSKIETALKKSATPVAVLSVPDFDAVTKRLEDAKQPLQHFKISDTFRIAITRDPSGNAIEILPGKGKPAVAGSRLVVNDRQKAEDFFVRVFGLTVSQRITQDTFDEVIFSVGDGPFLALFEPKNEAPLPKSEFPVVSMYTSDFDGVLERIKKEGLPHKMPTTSMIIATDPAGNGIEILKR